MDRPSSSSRKQSISLARLTREAGTPANYTAHHLDSVKETLKACLEPLGGIGAFAKPGSKVAIKVNAGFSGPPGVYTTDPRVVEALIMLLQECVGPREIRIAENAAEFHMLEEIGLGSTTMECFEACGLAAVAERRGVTLAAMENEIHEQVLIPGATLMTHCIVPRTILEADTLIFVPHLKNHMAAWITLCLKLSQGVIPTSEKKKFHDGRLTEKLLDLLRIIRPDLCIVDALWAMQGQGPTSQFPDDVIRDMDVLMAGTNPIAVDTVGALLMGLDPADVPVLALAAEMGLEGSDLRSIELLGVPIERCARKFRAPEMVLHGVFPNVVVYQGIACGGCLSHLRIFLDQLMVAGILRELRRTLTIIVGRDTTLPEKIPQPVLVVGDCAEEHRDRGLFVPGCCPLSHIFRGLLDQVSSICDLEQFRCPHADLA
jgi:uncharacterized protein (DUF362 family)